MIYLQLAWYYGYGFLFATACLLAVAVVITRAVVRNNLLRLMPSIARDQVLRARREAAHYRCLYQEADATVGRLRSSARGAIGAAGILQQQLAGMTQEEET
jgi:hypothetical protein